jgi:hypothetical protein
MPRVSRRSKRRRAGYDQEHINHLLIGVYLCPGHGFATKPRDHAGDFTDWDAMRRAWLELRHELLPAFIAEHPFQRPYAWWVFEAPERRRRTDGVVHPFDDRVRRQQVENTARTNPNFRETAYRLYYGRPSCLFMPDDFAAKYESQLEYLQRLNLLTEVERRELL